ncbi:phosphotransferase [Dictyobacter aurantiacus]|uniref:Spectinomycin phosphotransferase n=1 Tax=Dictyobacter aurantiacus TaxID=1936993 RepID=A0A401ZQI0_9CHLR|nr:aminoglycoside phosphotransferase family protein [Dictyobacter aurantiacus]GCE09119.1 spectinomycin phosphotransferase [Dictyobacter aurantiacus]
MNIAESSILSAVQEYFSLHLQFLEFLPVGEGAWVYKGHDESQSLWIVKLSRLNTPTVARVTSYLHDELGLSFVIGPVLPLDQRAIPRVHGYNLSLYPFLEGKTLSYDSLNEEHQAEIAQYLRSMHDAKLPQPIRALLPREAFDKFQASARSLVRKAREYIGNDALLERLRDIVMSQWDVIDQTIENGYRLSQYCKQHAYELVICHADIHPFNIIQTATTLIMIDWDGIMLAPRERDLMFYRQEMNAEDSDFHRAYGLDYHVDAYLMSYYNYEWVLQEYTDYIGRLFDMQLGEEARAHALDEFHALFGSQQELGGVVKEALCSPLPDAVGYCF